MDFIGAALKKMNVTDARAERAELCSPWRIEAHGDSRPAAYYFVRGQGEIALGSRETHGLDSGDLAFVPRGEQHRVSAEGASGAQSRLLHATISAEIRGDCPFISALPFLLILRAGERSQDPHLDALLQSIVWETARGGPGADLVLARLWEVVFLLAFRTYLAQTTKQTGWLAAIRDPQLARALGAIQQHPERDWTVERLAGEAAMSRATLIRQFVRVMGETPMRFLYLHRMGIAASLLQQKQGSIAEIATRVGYGSEAAFSNAFRRHFGAAPGAYRTANAQHGRSR